MAKETNPFERQVGLQQVEPRLRGAAKLRNANSTTPGRHGKAGMTQYFDADTHRMLREIALEQDKKIADLLREGVNLMLQHYGRRPIA